MSPKRKLLILAGILAAALVAAVPFLRQGEQAEDVPEPPQPSTPTLQVAAAEDREVFDLAVITDESVNRPDSEPSQPAVLVSDPQKPVTAADEEAAEEDETLPPPDLPEDFSASLADDDFASTPTSPPPEACDDTPATSRASVVSEPVFEQPPASVRRRYTVRDGDTLESLAARLLGDAKYADAIYRLNGDRLPSRDLLPIGVELLIPDVEPTEEESSAQR